MAEGIAGNFLCTVLLVGAIAASDQFGNGYVLFDCGGFSAVATHILSIHIPNNADAIAWRIQIEFHHAWPLFSSDVLFIRVDATNCDAV